MCKTLGVGGTETTRQNSPRLPATTSTLRTLGVLLSLAAISTTAFASPDGVLQKVTTIQVEPTVVEVPGNVKDPAAANLVRYDLRAAIRDSHLVEGASRIRAHIVLDQFTIEGKTKRVLGAGTGKTTNTVDGKLVIQDASGKELASVKIHMRGTVAFSPGDGSDTQGTQAVPDLERLLADDLMGLR